MCNKTWTAVGLLYLFAGAFSLSGQTPRLKRRTVPTGTSSPRPATSPAGPITLKAASTATLPAGLPLRVQLDRRYRMRVGQSITGRLIDPVYSGDHIVLPANTVVDGTISGLDPIGKQTRTWALLDGDVTPLKQPVLTFNAVELPGGRRLPLTANAIERTADIVKMASRQRKESLIGKVKDQVEAKKQSVEGVVHSPHKSDMAMKFAYGQLPYHPQDIWAGTEYDAVLGKPLIVPDKAQEKLPVTPPHGHIPPGTLDARLTTTISSATDKVGDPVVAVLTRPYLNQSKTDVILPTGTQLRGVVTQAKPARSLDRNGTLRFAFRQIVLPSGSLENMHGQMTAVEGASGQNVTVDSEGGAKANSAQGKFVAPLLLGALASHSFDSDAGAAESGAYSNGFGMVARIVGFVAVTPAVSAGFAFYSAGKSITRRWLMRGHNVVFEKNTRMQLAVTDR